ncbi:MAG: hypothetical protein ACXAC5_02175 [Promethearchaeota archaeon]|jgi:hypothetical protein
MVNKENVLHDLILVTPHRDKAEAQFFDTCSALLSNWDEYSSDDKQALLDLGYEQTGDGAIVLIDTDGITCDAQIAAEINKTPPPGVQRIKKWIRSGEIGELATIMEVMQRAGTLLDKSCAEEIFGSVIFEAEDGQVYVLNCEGHLGVINLNYLRDVLEEDRDE